MRLTRIGESTSAQRVGRDEDLACIRGPMGSGKNNELLEGCCRLVRGVGTKQEVSGPRDAGVGN